MTSGRLYALLGAPVHHSLSPALQNAALRALGIDALYVALRTWAELVGPLMRALAGGGGGGNVTLPHKPAAAKALDEASEAVRATGACNLFWWEEGRGLCGDNTDVEAFRAAAVAVLGQELEGCRVLLLGAGGAARAVVHACRAAKVDELAILNRTPERAAAMIRELGSPRGVMLLERGSMPEAGPFDLVVNATALGLGPDDPLPIDLEKVDVRAALDLAYCWADTRFVRSARELGIKAEDGRTMLVEGAAASFYRWFGQVPPRQLMLETVGLKA